MSREDGRLSGHFNYPLSYNSSIDGTELTPRSFDEYFADDDLEQDEHLLEKIVGYVLQRLDAQDQEMLALVMCGEVLPRSEGQEKAGWRQVGRELGMDHKTVKRRVTRALANCERELRALPSWVQQMLPGLVPDAVAAPAATTSVFAGLAAAVQRIAGAA